MPADLCGAALSTNPRNLSLYLRHGFDVLGEIRIGAAPLVTPMLRRSRR